MMSENSCIKVTKLNYTCKTVQSSNAMAMSFMKSVKYHQLSKLEVKGQGRVVT